MKVSMKPGSGGVQAGALTPLGWCGEQPHGPGLGDPPALPLPGPEK